MLPLNYILKKYSGGYKLHNLQEKINHLMKMDNIILFAKIKKELETLIQAMKENSFMETSSDK